MQALTRHQLKEDKLAEAAKGTFSWAAGHKRPVTVVSAAVVLAAALGVGGWFFLQHQQEKASLALGGALRTYLRQLRPAGVPADPENPTYTSSVERAKAARAEFQAVADQYSYTRSGKMARYYVGLTALEAGDAQGAERELKAVVAANDRDLAPLAKLALATVYRQQNREGEAIKLYRELIDNPSESVPKATAQLELGGLYEEKQPAEASKIYQQVRIENPTSAAGEIAASRLSLLGK